MKALAPNWWKITIAIVIVLLFVWLGEGKICAMYIQTCEVAAGTPDAWERPDGVYEIAAAYEVPGSCHRVCTASEQVQGYVKYIFFTIILPFVITYLFLSSIQQIIRKIKKLKAHI